MSFKFARPSGIPMMVTHMKTPVMASPDALANLNLCHMLAWTCEHSGRPDDAHRLAADGVERAEPGTILAIDFAIHTSAV